MGFPRLKIKSIDFRKMGSFFGPAYLIGVGYMDPGNWATDLAGGSSFEYKLVWVLLLSNILALFLQNLSTRFGIMTGMDLAVASRKYYNSKINFVLYILAEIAVSACDLAEIIGMAIGLKLLFGIPLSWGIYITFLDTFLILFLVGKKMKRLEIFIIGLISLISFSFLVELFLVKLQWAPIIQGFIPTEIHGEALFIALGIIGATVMPHNLYLHSSLVAHHHKKGDEKLNSQSSKFAFWDTALALNIAFLVNLAILILSAAAFHSHGFTKVAELEDAHRLLKQILGSISSTLFGIALLASGQSSTITGTLAGQVIMEGYLDIRVKPWIRRLITRSLALVPATLTIHYAGVNSLNTLLILSQIVLSIQLCYAIIPLLHFNSFKNWMGEWALSIYARIFGWITLLFIISINGYFLYTNIEEYLTWKSNHGIFLSLISWLGLILGLALLLYLALEPFMNKKEGERKNSWLIAHETESVNGIPIP